jgi:hypothetical protein
MQKNGGNGGKNKMSPDINSVIVLCGESVLWSLRQLYARCNKG